jgi:hypothetical protein
MLSGWGVNLRRRVVSWFAALVATMAVVATGAPGEAHAFAWKDACVIYVANNTGSLSGLKPKGLLPEIPPNPFDEAQWGIFQFPGNGIPLGPNAAHLTGGAKFSTIGFPVTWGCAIHPAFQRGSDAFECDVFAPSSGRNIFQCTGVPGVSWRITKDNDDIEGIVTVGPRPAAGGSQPSSPAVSVPKRVRALLRRADLPGRGWRLADKPSEFGRLGQIFAANNVPASCRDNKTREPQAKRGGASAFARRSTIIGYEHGVYAGRRQSRQRLRAAVSAHSIRCLARLLTSARFHTQARFARYSLPGLEAVGLWRVVARTRAGNRVTRTDYVDVAGLLHGRSNGLVLFAQPNQPVSRAVERSVIRAVARRLP